MHNNLFLMVGAPASDVTPPIGGGLHYLATHLRDEQSQYYYAHRWPGYKSWVATEYWLEIDGHTAYQPAEPHPYPLNLNCDFGIPEEGPSGVYVAYTHGPVQGQEQAYCVIDNHPLFTLTAGSNGFVVDSTMTIHQLTDDTSQRAVALFSIHNPTLDRQALSLCMRRHKDTNTDDFWLALMGPNGLETKTETFSFESDVTEPFNFRVTVQNGRYAITLNHPLGTRSSNIRSQNAFVAGDAPELRMFHARERPSEPVIADLYHLKIDTLGGI